MRRILFLLALLPLAAGCTDGAIEPGSDMSAEARAHLEEVTGIMREHSVHRLTIDWDEFDSRVFGAARGARTIADLQLAILEALTVLNDGHSQYRASNGRVLFVSTRTCSALSTSIPTVPADIGYIRVGAFSGTAAEAAARAEALQFTIETRYRDDLVGWIVDVRGNGGGNMWPMIAGIGPLLGEGTLGHFVYPDGESVPWGYRPGEAWLGDAVTQPVADPYELPGGPPRIAVLTNQRIASSGEAVVIALRQRPDTRSFGSPTCGLSTANQGFPLRDGGSLILTVAVMADRTGTEYGRAVGPDEIVSGADAVVQRAIEWLREENP